MMEMPVSFRHVRAFRGLRKENPYRMAKSVYQQSASTITVAPGMIVMRPAVLKNHLSPAQTSATNTILTILYAVAVLKQAARIAPIMPAIQATSITTIHA
jgi:hypothetical protein